jgi:hypothetical protein
MVLRYVDLSGKQFHILPYIATTVDQADPISGIGQIQINNSTGWIKPGTAAVDVDLSTCPIMGPSYACSGQWADQTGTAVIQFPPWVAGSQGDHNPTPAGALLTGVICIMDSASNPTFPTGFQLETPTPVSNGNGNCKAYAFRYYCNGTESGTLGGNNPTTKSITYATSSANISAVLLWEVNSNADVAIFSMIANPSTPAAATHSIPTTTFYPGVNSVPTVMAIVGRTSQKLAMGAHAVDGSPVVERQSASTAFTTKNNMGGVIYDERRGPATPYSYYPVVTLNRQASTAINSFTVGMVWALKKVFS